MARVALVTAIALPAVQMARAVAQPALADATFNPVNRLVLLAAVLASAAIFAARQFRLASPWMVLRLGMAWQVVIAFALAMIETTGPAAAPSDLGRGPLDRHLQRPGAQPPDKALYVGLAAATAWPVAYMVNAARGLAPDLFVLWPALNYGLAALAFLDRPHRRWRRGRDRHSDDDIAAIVWNHGSAKAHGGVWKASHNCWRAPPP